MEYLQNHIGLYTGFPLTSGDPVFWRKRKNKIHSNVVFVNNSLERILLIIEGIASFGICDTSDLYGVGSRINRHLFKLFLDDFLFFCYPGNDIAIVA